MCIQLRLDLDRDVEQHAVAGVGVRHQHPDLPEVGLLLARGVPQRGAVDAVLDLGQHAQAGAMERLPRGSLHPLVVGGP